MNEIKSTPRLFVELFSGSAEISEVFSSYGYETLTVDSNEKLKPDICLDIMNLRRTVLPRAVDVVWASIPCTTFSTQSISYHFDKIEIGYRKYYYLPKTDRAIISLKLVTKTLELIKKINPKYYFIENPRGGLRHLPNFDMCPFRYTVSYADYGFDIYKPTDIFTNYEGLNLIPIRTSVGRTFKSSVSSLKSNYERSKVPGTLIQSIVSQIDY